MENENFYHVYPRRDPICVSHYPNPVNAPEPGQLPDIFGLVSPPPLDNLGIVYVHVPFCVEICGFCPFNKVLAREQDMERYMSAIKKEIEMVATSTYARHTSIDSVYFGGGTPSALTADRMIEMLSFIKTQYHLLPDAQVTFEGSPGTFDRMKLEGIRKAGANRISIGVQTFNETMGRDLGISHSPQQALEALKNAANAGFTNIGIDLMYNLPGQGPDDWLADVKKAIEMGIVHITLFSLCIVPFTNFAKQVERGDVPAPGNENYEIDLFIAARELLLKSGYVQYSVWDFAKPGYIDKHVTWYYKKQKDLFAHGPGAFGYINRCMYINRGNLPDYFKSLQNGFLPVEVEAKADEVEAMNGMMAKSLRMVSVDRAEFAALFHHDPVELYEEKINRLTGMDLLEVTPNEIRLTEKGMIWGNNVCKEFFSETNKQSFEARMRLARGKNPNVTNGSNMSGVPTES